MQSAAGGVLQFFSAEVEKCEAVALFPIPFLDGIGKAAYQTYDRHVAITACDHLCQAAGLASGRHEQNISGCIDLVSGCCIELDHAPHLIRMALLQADEEIFIFLIAGSQHDELDVVVIQEIVHHLNNEIDALWRDQTGDHSHHRNITDRQSQLTLKCSLAAFLALQLVRRKCRFNERIVFRIVSDGIDAVEDALHLAQVALYDFVKTKSADGVGQFHCVIRTDGGETVS